MVGQASRLGKAHDECRERIHRGYQCHAIPLYYFPRKLPAEVLLDAMGQVTGIPHQFKGYPEGTSAKDLYIPDGPDYFLVTFGFPRRDILSERRESPSLNQALHMMNGQSVKEKVESDKNILAELLKQGLSEAEMIKAIMERAYARLPEMEELKSIQESFQAERVAGRSQRRILESFLWAVLNSKEFQLNH